MPTETLQEVHFPKTGHAYAPLPSGKEANRVQAHAVQTIAASPEQIFNVYTRIEMLPAWQEGVISVTRTGDKTLHWIMEDPGTGKQFEFDAEELEVIPGKRHVSRVISGPTAGTTEIFTLEPHPAGRGTITTFVTDFTLPGGALTHTVSAVVSRSPSQVVVENLRHLKELMESGEIPTVEGQPAGRRGISGKLKKFLLGENMPTPPGTSNRAKPQDMPKLNLLGRSISTQTLTTVGLVTVPLIFGVILWASLSDND
ncbi:SRPBCC family protein [Terriglobus sp.]|uniref:SRPBCC family protein n=1 Tax=Terriglobus sp. TaxID=1889013 RepID=UPI003B002267